MKVTPEQALQCAQECRLELDYRKKVYPRLVAKGWKSSEASARRMDIMAFMARYWESMSQPGLFENGLEVLPADVARVVKAARALHELLHREVAAEEQPPAEGLIQLVADESVAQELATRLSELRQALEGVKA